MTSTPDVADERLLNAHDLARAALREITAESSIGDAAGYTLEADGVVSLRFNNRMAGYPGWFWTVSVAVVDGAEPTVLEVELLPGDGALLAPEWVPWAVRLADYQSTQAALAAEANEDDESEDSDADADDDDDADDVDDLDDDEDEVDDASPILHGGDLDGVDIDELDVSADGEESDEDDDDSDVDGDDESDEDKDKDDDEDDSDDEFEDEGLRDY